MLQQDLFLSSSEDYLYSELQKTKYTVDKLRKSFHANMAEMHDTIISLKKYIESLENKNG